VRVCLVYDCLFPHTVGGAERWYANVARQLAADGHDVTYLTLRQWEDDAPGIDGVRIVAVGPQFDLYRRGRRRILPPLVFGLGVLAHLVRHGRRYDVVHTASFPYFSVLAAAVVRPVHRFRLVVDWHEVWTSAYWREYLGPLGGRAGSLVQALCMRAPQRAFCFSQLHARRLRGRVKGTVSVLEGEYDGALEQGPPQPAAPVVVFAGRHIPEKRVPDLIPAIALAREAIPGLTAIVFGDGPDREETLRRVRALALEDVVTLPGFVSDESVTGAFASALCHVLPSRREGYGLVVVEAAARGVPSVVADSPDNAAVELIEPGVNGFIAGSSSADDMATAIVCVHQAGPELRQSTADWFARNADRLSLRASLSRVSDAYGQR
jgi:glycosyltransferase involved in cell wall biosynthesis